MNRNAGRVGDMHLCPAVSVAIPHVGGPTIAPGIAFVPVMVEGVQALRLGDHGMCGGPLDTAIEGAANVLVCGLPWVGRFHKTAHGGMLVGAAPKVVLGGATFALPACMRISGPSWFQNWVVRDLFALYSTPSGLELWRRLTAAGRTITIIPETDPYNSFARTDDPEAASRGQPTGATVMYNPRIGTFEFDQYGRKIVTAPQLVLAHELVHALNFAEGHHYLGPDPAHPKIDPRPPRSEPNILEVEAAAIGTGSHQGDFPTQNTFRRDFQLPRRDNHLGVAAPAPTDNRRPGGY